MADNRPAFNMTPDDERISLLRREICHARKSPFYREYLKDFELNSFEDLKNLPYTSAGDICANGTKTVCVSAREISRIVTLQTSGTSGKPKRLYFTAGDIERTVEFFAEGMSTMCRKGDRAAILMNCVTTAGVGQLLAEGLRRIGVTPYPIGILPRPKDKISELISIKPEIIIGIPWQVRALAIACPELRPERILLSGDYVPEKIDVFFRKKWGAETLNHFGMTETCYGCAVEVKGYDGMLLRTDELFAETTEEGELCITTLKREAMPLIRYKTGDYAELSDDGRRILRVYGRKERLKACRIEDAVCGIEYLHDYILKDGNIIAKVSSNSPDGFAGELSSAFGAEKITVIKEPDSSIELFSEGKRTDQLCSQ